MKSVLVTGGTGFLGSHVVDTLSKGSYYDQVFVGSRSVKRTGPYKYASILPLDLEISADSMVLPAQVHTIIHIAGEKNDSKRMDKVNHIGTKNLVAAAASAEVKRFIYVSSVGVYGAYPHAGLVTENYPHTPRNLYEESKDAGEKCVHELCARFGIEYVVVQPSNVVGIAPGHSYPLLGLMRMVKHGRFTWFGDTEPWVNYVSVEDVASAIITAAERAPSGQTFIINTPERLRNVVCWISEELGVNVPRRCLPMWVGNVAAGMGSALTGILKRSMPFNREKLLELTNTTRYDGSALERIEGFEYPFGVTNMIQNMVRAYLHKGLL